MKNSETIDCHTYGPDYCVSSQESRDAQQKIMAWIAKHENAGCTIEFRIKGLNHSEFGVMWQVISDPKRPYPEFSPCIDMTGHEFSMN